MINRPDVIAQVTNALANSRVVALIGPRQCGKTTIARMFVPSDSVNYFDLEDPISLARLSQPMTALQGLTGTVAIDEIQRFPDLFPVLRVLSDRTPLPAKFLILGSVSLDLLRQSSESLAGRISIITMSGFSLREVGAQAQNTLWRRGGFPLSYTASSEESSLAWRKNFISTFLERDVPQFGINIPATTLLRFWNMLAHYHGQVWNAAELARMTSVGETSARRYVDLLQDLYMVRLLQPWFNNMAKRQIKSPKLYIRDTGLLHSLLSIRTEKELYDHPRSGASWEGFALEETLKAVRPEEAYFWAKHSGAELDLLMVKDSKRIGVECKRMDAPTLTPSMHSALAELELHRLLVIYPGNKKYLLSKNVKVVPLSILASNPTEITD